MKNKLLSRTLGIYMPSFFCMELNIPFNFEDVGRNSDREISTFIHEYIHYIQDVTTTNGYMNLIHSINLLQTFFHKAAISENNLIRLPIRYDDIENAEERNLQMEIISGDSDYITRCYIDKIEIKEEELYREFFGENNLNAKKCENIEVHYHSNGKYNVYKFGSMCIMESMAYLIESHIFSQELRCNELPYNACEMVCQNIYPEFAKYPINIVALCDVSLMTTNPAETFLLVLSCMKNSNILPKQEDDIYKFVFQYLKPNYIEEFCKEKEQAFERIDFLYSINQKETLNINRFLKDVINRAEDIRKNKCSFISKIMNMDKNIAINYVFKDIIKRFAVPVIKDKDSNLYMYNFDKLDLSLVVASRAIFDISFNPKSKNECYMYNICKKSNGMCNENCLNKPWKMSEKEELCPFAQFWYRFSLSGKEVIRN